MNLLAKSEVFAENKLFATLDTTVRKVVIENVPFLLSDTVGFIRKLPTQLIEAFKSTLDEVREADILVHVVDISHPDFEDQMKVVENTLKDIGANEKPVYVVFNKIDAYEYEEYDEFSLTPKGKENRSLETMDSWLRRRIRMCIWRSWKKPSTRVKNLVKCGIPQWRAYMEGNSSKGYWANAGGIMQKAASNENLRRAGYPCLMDYYAKLHLQ